MTDWATGTHTAGRVDIQFDFERARREPRAGRQRPARGWFAAANAPPPYRPRAGLLRPFQEIGRPVAGGRRQRLMSFNISRVSPPSTAIGTAARQKMPKSESICSNRGTGCLSGIQSHLFYDYGTNVDAYRIEFFNTLQPI